MPIVENTDLQLLAVPGKKFSATVTAAIRFSSAEVTRKAIFLIEVALHASDDWEYQTPFAGPIVFTWKTVGGQFPFATSALRVPAQSTPYPLKETRTYPGASLDEDQGWEEQTSLGHIPDDLPDEFLARVTVRPLDKTAVGESVVQSIRALGLNNPA